MQSIAEILKIINEKNLNVSDISRRTGIPGTRIYKWLDGKGRPKVEDAAKMQAWAGKYLEVVPTEGEGIDNAELGRAQPHKITDRDIYAMFLTVSAAQTEILRDIKQGMARQESQATIEDTVKRIESSLTETLAGVEFVSGRQLQKILSTLTELKAQKKGPSPGDRKKRGEIGGDGHKSGIKT